MSRTALAAASLVPSDEMARLHRHGFSLVPLGKGTDGKSPLLSFGSTQRIPLPRALAPMHRAGSLCYGILLDGLAVVDCDTDDPLTVEKMEARFGASPVHVRTPRGRHLYYRAGAGHYPNLRAEGLPVDIKRGPTSYVRAPAQSVRTAASTFLPKGFLAASSCPRCVSSSPPAGLGASAKVAATTR